MTVLFSLLQILNNLLHFPSQENISLMILIINLN